MIKTWVSCSCEGCRWHTQAELCLTYASIPTLLDSGTDLIGVKVSSCCHIQACAATLSW